MILALVVVQVRVTAIVKEVVMVIVQVVKATVTAVAVTHVQEVLRFVIIKIVIT